MVLNPYGLRIAYAKTDGRCAICGESEDTVCTGFIPTWTRVPFSLDNVIPLCDKCRLQRKFDFIELGKLVFLSELGKQQLMRFYRDNSKYLKMYVRKFGRYRTGNQLDINYALLVLSSYDMFIIDHSKELDWESMR